MKKIISLIFAISIIFGMSTFAYGSNKAFSDVSKDHWALPYITMAAERGIINGIGNNKFNPE